MPQVGPLEILVIFIVALLVFGPTKLPEIGRQVGRGIRELRRLQDNLRRDLDDVLGDDETSGAAPAPSLPPKQSQGGSGPATSPETSPPADPTA
jgi:TatA/E family protein of Tat protein translocase